MDDCKKQYYSNIIIDSKDPKILWKCLHSLNPSNPLKPNELLNDNDQKITDPKEIADTFNDFFTSCVQNLKNETNTLNI